MQISSLLHVGRGVTAIIGSGGKTTLMEQLAKELSKKGKVILTTTTHIRRPARYPVLEGADERAVAAALAEKNIVCVGEAAEDGKLCAPKISIEALARLADFVLVEADGAKGLPLKAHEAHEPVIPPCAQRVVTVVGIDGIGRPISEVSHRSARYAQLAGVDEETTVTPRASSTPRTMATAFTSIRSNLPPIMRRRRPWQGNFPARLSRAACIRGYMYACIDSRRRRHRKRRCHAIVALRRRCGDDRSGAADGHSPHSRLF